jgi:hypothetical protein
MSSKSDNEERLRDAGVIIAALPPEYAAVVEGMTPDEIDVIVAVKRRLDEAGRVSGVDPGAVMIPP